MEQKDMVHITAVTQVRPDGEKCTQAVIEYKEKIEPSMLGMDTFEVKDRTITGIEMEGNKVTLYLDEKDEEASTLCPGMPWKGTYASLKEAKVLIQQKKDIQTQDGRIIRKTDEWIESDQTCNKEEELFIQMAYQNQNYNLYIPKDYDPRKKYPLVQFIHDAAACGKDTRLALAQGTGALVWASPEVQKEHPCFVFAPQFDGPPIVDDEWNVDERLEDAKVALDNVLDLYSIDRNRIYTTGQSMGCMASIVLNIRYPDYFAASYLVAGQWDERNIPGLEKQKLWMLCSQGDAKAFPTMNQMCVNMERAGARVTRRVIDAGLSQEDYAKIAEEIMEEKPNIIFTPYNLESVADGWHSNGGEHHISTWRTAYGLKVIRDWLFAQSREE